MTLIKPKLAVYLLSYNRPEFIDEAIQSVLNQDYLDFELIVSENSPTEKIYNSLKKYSDYSKFKAIKRSPSLPVLDHFNLIINESKDYEYLMMFHDDDVMIEGCLSKLMNLIESNSELSAVCGNAYIIENGIKTIKLISKSLIKTETVKTQEQLFDTYVFKKLTHPPFPGYIYRRNKIENLQLIDSEAGKYSDVVFLLKAIQNSHFYWTPDITMYYRLHSGNDSNQISLIQTYRLCLYLVKTNRIKYWKIIYFYLKIVLIKIIRN